VSAAVAAAAAPIGRLRTPQGFEFDARASLIADAGLGLFATTDIAAGAVIAEYSSSTGPIGIAQAVKIRDERRAYLMRVGPGVYVVADLTCASRYINDARNPSRYNVRFDKRPEEGRALVVATRAIAAGEELYVDYGRLYWLKSPGTKLPDAPVREHSATETSAATATSGAAAPSAAPVSSTSA